MVDDRESDAHANTIAAGTDPGATPPVTEDPANSATRPGFAPTDATDVPTPTRPSAAHGLAATVASSGGTSPRAATDGTSRPSAARGVAAIDGTDPTLAASTSLGPTAVAASITGDATASPPTLREHVTGAQTIAMPNEVGRYKLAELIGRGGMGEVVAAHDERIGREVAVKRIRGDQPGPEELSRFVREALVQGRLQHPAVVPVHDLGVDRDGRPFFVMKRLAGTVMSDMLKDADPVDQTTRRKLLRAFADVCIAIEFAHSRGIVHRDLKPSNIMLGDFNEVYVLDWGIARTVRDEAAPSRPSHQDLELSTGETRAGTILGTPAYMAPEQMAGEAVGPAADVYALGCILYEIVAGEALHRERRTIASTFAGPLDARPSRVRPETPPELDSICVLATQLDISARTPSARALGDAVQAYLDGDRDMAMRRELALAHIAEAQAALAGGDDEERRKTAMRAAGRALALDPTATEAADLVTHLVLRPPEKVPAEVDRLLATVDTDMARAQGRLSAFTFIGYLGFVPLMLWTGVRDATMIVAFVIAVIVSGLQIYALTHRDELTPGPIYLTACINAVILALIARIVGPFIIAPTLVATTLMGYAAHPRFGRITPIAFILSCGVIVPWLLELAGVLDSTYSFDHGKIVLSSPVIEFHALPVQIAMAALLVATVIIVALLSRMMAARQRAASRSVELQAWHLRQLVPTRSRH